MATSDLTGRELDAEVSRVVYGDDLRRKPGSFLMETTAEPPHHDPLQVREDVRKRGGRIYIEPTRDGDIVSAFWQDGPNDEHAVLCTFTDLRETILRAAVRLCEKG